MRIVAVILAIFLPSGAAAQGADRVQEIYGFRVTPGELVVRVPTGGCTRKASFRASSRLRGGERQVSLARIRKDECKGYFPEGVDIRFARGEFPPQGRLQVVNPIRLLPRTN